MALPRLGTRLQHIADCVPPCELAADIGADHGKLTAWLLLSGRCQRMIASDISSAAREKARVLFERRGISDRVLIRGDDGLRAIKEPVQWIIISGMGGGKVSDMLMQDVDLYGASLLISAQTELPRLRETLASKAYRIVREDVVKANGRFYLICHASPGRMTLTDREKALGVNLTATRTARPADYLRWQLSVTDSWQREEADRIRGWIKEMIEDEEAEGTGGL